MPEITRSPVITVRTVCNVRSPQKHARLLSLATVNASATPTPTQLEQFSSHVPWTFLYGVIEAICTILSGMTGSRAIVTIVQKYIVKLKELTLLYYVELKRVV